MSEYKTLQRAMSDYIHSDEEPCIQLHSCMTWGLMQQGRTWRDVSKRLGIDQGLLGRYTRGERKCPADILKFLRSYSDPLTPDTDFHSAKEVGTSTTEQLAA